MSNLKQAKQERALGEGWFNGEYTEAKAKWVAEMQSLTWDMVEHWRNYCERTNKNTL